MQEQLGQIRSLLNSLEHAGHCPEASGDCQWGIEPELNRSYRVGFLCLIRHSAPKVLVWFPSLRHLGFGYIVFGWDIKTFPVIYVCMNLQSKSNAEPHKNTGGLVHETTLSQLSLPRTQILLARSLMCWIWCGGVAGKPAADVIRIPSKPGSRLSCACEKA